jgi:hypothetical protein
LDGIFPSDRNLQLSDITTNNVSTTKHGFVPKATGVTTDFLSADGTYRTPAGGGGTAATQAEMEAASSTSVYASPGRTQYHPGVAKGWCLFTSVTTTAITASYNVASLTDNGTGDTTITWDTDFSSANYCVVTSTIIGATTYVVAELNSAKAAGSTRIQNVQIGVALVDAANQSVAAFGDQ